MRSRGVLRRIPVSAVASYKAAISRYDRLTKMRIFLVAVGAGEPAHELAHRVIIDSGAQSYADAAEFFPDGVQDPYRAVDESDAIVWLYKPVIGFSRSDYNYLYTDSVMQRAVRTRKVVLYYEFQSDVHQTMPAVMALMARRSYGIQSLDEFERSFRKDLQDLMAGIIRFSEAPLKVFPCHSKLDKIAVRQMWQQLLERGVHPWLDEEDLVGGEDWELAINKAIRTSHAILVFLSRKSVNTAGFAHKELRLALDVADRQPEGAIFIIPLRLDDCQVPERLRSWHWIDLFDESGFSKLIRALRQRARDLEIETPGFDQ
jgi:hypothetical protein